MDIPVVAVVGSTMTDLVTYVERAPGAGETVVGQRFVVGFGGKGANQAVMARRLGAQVAFVGCLGDDAYGTATCHTSRAEGVDVAELRRHARSERRRADLGRARRHQPDHRGPGSQRRAHGAPRPRCGLEGSDQVHVVVGQLEVPQAATAAGLAAGRQRGAVDRAQPGALRAGAAPTCWQQADWLVPNEVEFAALAVEHGVARASADARDERPGRRARPTRWDAGWSSPWARTGAAVLVDGQVHRVPAPPARAVDTTGAGDGFVGAFAVGLAEGLHPLAAARLGCACASWSVEREGTQTSFPSTSEAAELRARLAG